MGKSSVCRHPMTEEPAGRRLVCRHRVCDRGTHYACSRECLAKHMAETREDAPECRLVCASTEVPLIERMCSDCGSNIQGQGSLSVGGLPAAHRCAGPRWGTVYIEARMWHCGDECCCTQPEVTTISPNLKAGRPWVTRVALWRGTFFSEADREERALQVEELRVQAEEFKIPLVDGYGVRVL